MRLIKITLFIIIISVFGAVFVSAAYADEEKSQLDLCKESLKQAVDIIKFKSLNKIDKLEIPQIKSAEQCKSAFETILKQLGDKYGNILTPEEKKAIEELEKPYGGIGIIISLIKDYPSGPVIRVDEVLDNSPAQKAGIKIHDLITKIDDIPAKDIATSEKAIELIRGLTGSEVQLSIIRPTAENQKIFILNIKREIIQNSPVNTLIFQPKIGYLKIRTFHAENISGKITEGLSQLILSETKGFIIDLRDNLGGYWRAAIFTISLFLMDENQELVFLIEKDNETSNDYSTPKGGGIKKPLIILINGESASASEMVAGALQYYKKAILVGTKTFGKGSVTTSVKLDNGYWLVITAAKYYFPNGFSPEGVGITPDIIIENDDQKPGDEQLEKAIEVMNDLLDKTPDIFMEENDQKLDDEPPEKIIEFINGLLNKN